MTIVVPALSNSALEPVYRDYYHACETLAGIEAIDYYSGLSVIDSLVAGEHRIDQHQYQQLLHLVMALLQAHRQGHSCTSVKQLSAQRWFVDDLSASERTVVEPKQGFRFASFEQLDTLLIQFFSPDQQSELLVYEYGNLYLRRYYRFEVEVANAINDKCHRLVDVDEARCQAIIEQLFEDSDGNTIDWQAVSVANALNKSLAIIAGGPGTGKTYTVTKLLLALLMLDESLHIEMAAPTGKAAQRLSESIVSAVNGFQQQTQYAPELLAKIPTQASTIHRLLGFIPNSVNFKHNETNPLLCDVLLIDEVSMVDLAMMSRIFRALKPTARIIMLGDANQLPSVATGSVLADLAPYGKTQLGGKNLTWLTSLASNFSAIDAHQQSLDYLCYLTYSRRFRSDGGIGQLAACVINGDAEKGWQLISQGDEEVAWSGSDNFYQYLVGLVNRYYVSLLRCDALDEAFALLDGFRILSPGRNGEYGVDHINQSVEQILQSKGLVYDINKPYHGKPIMITENHYPTGLYNGDIGLLWQIKGQPLVAYFQDGNGYRRVPLARLPSYETVFAMTIHKTQGSEFSRVAMVVSDMHQRLLSRELLYTGITRAKKHIELYCRQSVFERSVLTKVNRASGLTARIINKSSETTNQP
ncbi:exodeoxyribonuclease V subunit alpha [Thalassotalea ponticola]|uniref:exodeoxyribonuclease V subunit alpha n=1 Tax=Thalassotalea ponticola TaxID=1523392 RepID=UPI0025B3288E|nr:exodeoxyribonuclease V subunit alpha [Thalassotalea ponticola]MDN3653114.1 exodeoxyribonuclease V subunit alpha [Thalassotalea ponticola]